MKKLLIVILTMMMILFFIACTPAGPFTLTLNITGTGSVTLNPIGGTYEAGKVVTLTATPNPAYTFTGWGGDLSGSTNPTTITMDSNKTVSVSFTEKSYAYDWLIIMYLDGDNNVENTFWTAIGEIEKGLYNLQQVNSTLFERIKVVALWDGINGYDNVPPSGSKLYELGPDSSENNTLSPYTLDLTSTGGGWISGGEVNMGSGATVTNYLNWVIANYTDFKYYAFFLCDHGGGVGKGPKPITKAICWDETNGEDYLNTVELEEAIANAGFSATNKLDLIGMEACLMGNIEEVYQLRNVANYIAASPQVMQIDGLEYGDGETGYGWIDHMTDNMSASDLAIVIAQSCESNFGGDQTMTVVDLSKMEELKTAVDDLGTAINSAGSAARSAAKNIMNNTYMYYWDFPYLRDFGEFCVNVANSTNSNITQTIKDAATTAGDVLGNTIPWAYGPGYSGVGTDHNLGLSIVDDVSAINYSILDFNGGGWSTLLNSW